MIDADEIALFPEMACIGSAVLLGDRPWPEELATLQSDDFASADHAAIWDAVVELRDRHEPVDEVTVVQVLKEWGDTVLGVAFLGIVDGTPTALNADTYARIVRSDGRKRRLAAAVTDIAIRSTETNADDMAAAMADAIRRAERNIGGVGLRPLRDIVQSTVRNIEARMLNPQGGRLCRTGLRDLDDLLRLDGKDLTIVAGRPSMGKTALAANIAAACADDATLGSVAMFSLEMAAEKLGARLMQREAREHKGDLQAAMRAGRISEIAQKLYGLHLHIDDRPALSIEQIRAQLARLNRVRLVVVDYLQLASTGKRNDKRHDLEVGALTKGLKALAKEFDCHVVCLSQLNRDVEKRPTKKPTMADLRDSGNIEEDADNILLMYREEYYFREKPEAKGIAQILVEKQRDGETGVVHVAWIAERQAFEDLERVRKSPPNNHHSQPDTGSEES